MTKPKRVVVLGQEFKVIYVSNFAHYGETCTETFQIKINSRLKEKQLEATLLHEVIHAILFISGWSFTLDPEDGPDKRNEEGLVRALEHGLKDLVTFIS